MARQPSETPGETGTTGHSWDGIEEYDRPLPKWWLWTFYATIVWAVGYWVLMPSFPLVSDYARGLLGYSQREVLMKEMEAARTAQAQYADRIRTLPVAEVRSDPALLEFALAAGRSAFAVNCSQCHGQGAEGSRGYPNLNDDAWLWGGSLSAIQQTIRHGIRSSDPDTRESQMPAFLADGILTPAQVNDAAEFVLSLSGRATEPAAAERGRTVFADNCAACHGESGTGNQEVGAPNLTSAIWLYGGDKPTIVQTISYARRGVMPAWQGRLDDATIKALAVYVHSLGGGQ
ncbi:MAG: cytochrome-c oxidase, cbb3-type subunit III [Alphaproteobacteria bacterium]